MHKLSELEQKGLYVFHGSGVKLSRLEPRQAYSIINGCNEPDGKPGLHASCFTEYAIFMAIISPDNCPFGIRSSCSYENGKLQFSATRATLEQLNENSAGFVYVLIRSDFVQRNHTEWVCYESVEPIEIIEVKRIDLKSEISIIEEDN